jgi:hypothetical protein
LCSSVVVNSRPHDIFMQEPHTKNTYQKHPPTSA